MSQDISVFLVVVTGTIFFSVLADSEANLSLRFSSAANSSSLPGIFVLQHVSKLCARLDHRQASFVLPVLIELVLQRIAPSVRTEGLETSDAGWAPTTRRPLPLIAGMG